MLALTRRIFEESEANTKPVFIEGRQKTMVFDVANPLIASSIIKLCC
jgi:hypothetical protein